MFPLELKLNVEVAKIKTGNFEYDDFGRPTTKSKELKRLNPCHICNEPFQVCACKRKKSSFGYNTIKEVIVGAFEGGINYWLYFDYQLNEHLDFLKNTPFSVNILRNLYFGKEIILSDSEDKDFTGPLTLDKLENVLKDVNIENMDAYVYDKIIQTATFGKIVFG
jgi:hypothetical protein